MKPEATVQAAIKRFMDTLGFAAWDTSQGYRKERGGTRMTPGIPDMIFAGHGRTFLVEVKTERGKLTPAQQLFRELWTANGGTSLVWRSDLDAFDWCASVGIIEAETL